MDSRAPHRPWASILAHAPFLPVEEGSLLQSPLRSGFLPVAYPLFYEIAPPVNASTKNLAFRANISLALIRLSTFVFSQWPLAFSVVLTCSFFVFRANFHRFSFLPAFLNSRFFALIRGPNGFSSAPIRENLRLIRLWFRQAVLSVLRFWVLIALQ